jgi:hypothetical protein
MRSTTCALIFLLLLSLAVPGVATAVAPPSYFADGWVGFLCLTATPPGSGPTTVLLQLNFDKIAFGGVPLGRADALFTYLGNNLGLLSPVLGNSPQKTCSLTPSQVVVMFPGATALDAVQQVSGSFQQLGFSRYVIYDVFLSATLLYFGAVNTVRGEAYQVNGPNDLSYAMSTEFEPSLLP